MFTQKSLFERCKFTHPYLFLAFSPKCFTTISFLPCMPSKHPNRLSEIGTNMATLYLYNMNTSLRILEREMDSVKRV